MILLKDEETRKLVSRSLEKLKRKILRASDDPYEISWTVGRMAAQWKASLPSEVSDQ